MVLAGSAEELVALGMFQWAIAGILGAINAQVVALANIGYAMGLMQVVTGLGLELWPVVGGLVADAYGYRAVFHNIAVLQVIASVVVLFAMDEQHALSIPDKKTISLYFKCL